MSAVAGSYEFSTFKIGSSDITNGKLKVVDCNIYESCMDHHTYADVTVFDPDDVLSQQMFSGDEEVEIGVKVPGGQNEAKFKFKMLQNTDVRHQGALKAKTYRFHMASPELLHGQSTSVAKSWNKETHEIVKDIVKDYWKSDKEVEVEKTKNKQRFVGNNKPPHVVLDQLKNRHVSSENKSSAYTLFETRDDNGKQKFKFVTFEKLMKNKGGSSGNTYKQNPAMGQKTSTTGDDMWNIIALNLPETFNTIPRWSSATNQSSYCMASGKQQSKDIKYKDEEKNFKYLGESPIRKAEWDQVDKNKKPWRHTVIDKANDKEKTEIAEMRAKKAAYMARLMNDVGTMQIHGNPNIKVGDVIKIEIGQQADGKTGESKQITASVLVVNLRHVFGLPNERPGPYTMIVEFIKAGYEEGVG